MDPTHDSDEDAQPQAFLVRDGMREGRSWNALSHPRWHRPFRGVRSRDPVASHLYGRALQYLPRVRPGDRFSHATALALMDCPIRVRKQAAVDVSCRAGAARVECQGVVGHRHPPGSITDTCLIPDPEACVPTSPPLVAVLEAAGTLPFPELVVALDFLLLDDPRRYDRHLHVTIDELASFAKSATGRGVVRFRAAASLARIGAESRMETLMRLAAVRVGMPELELQFDVQDGNGRWIGRFDAADAATRSLFEYDGEQHHFSRRQRRRDPVKHQAARDAGWRIQVFFHEDIRGGLLSVGHRMLAFSGRPGRRIPSRLAKLLDEQSGDGTEPTAPLRRMP